MSIFHLSGIFINHSTHSPVTGLESASQYSSAKPDGITVHLSLGDISRADPPLPMQVDYSIIGHQCFPHMKPEEFISMMSSPKLLGDPLVHTQHLLGAAKYEWVSETEIVAVYHIRAAPQHYTNLDLAIGATSMALLSTGMGRLMESGSLLECVRSFIGLSMTFPRSSPNHLHRKGQEALFS